MKNVFKRVGAVVMVLAMLLSMSAFAFADATQGAKSIDDTTIEETAPDVVTTDAATDDAAITTDEIKTPVKDNGRLAPPTWVTGLVLVVAVIFIVALIYAKFGKKFRNRAKKSKRQDE